MSSIQQPVRPDPTSPDRPWRVAELAEIMGGYIGKLGSVWIEGEITQWGSSGGNVYGKLKDVEDDITISFNIWSSTRAKLTEPFAQGDRVIVRVKPNYWVKGGTLSFVVSEIRKAGIGELLEKIEQLRRTLAAEGLFAAERKKPLPFLPKLIGLITGKDSDAEKDVLRNAQLRWPEVRFRIHYAAVQGERTVPEVMAALAALDADPEVDVIIIARGGGDFQNLLGFSDERLVRAAAAASTPIVSAIGHEADRPLLDEVADLRASTPTDAAKRVVPDIAEELLKIRTAKNTLRLSLNNLLVREIERIALLRSRPALADPSWIIDQRSDDLQRLKDRAFELTQRSLERAQSELREITAALRSLSPQSTLARGYAIVQNSAGGVVQESATLSESENLLITFRAGKAKASVTEILR